jgi:SSS family solute:Na+ symporter
MFMLTTSVSQDLYKRFLAPAATDDHVLAFARRTAVISGAIAVVFAVLLEDVIAALTIFYTLLGVSLFVPVIAGLYAPRTTARSALLAIGAGICGMMATQALTAGAGWGLLSPALAGLLAAILAWSLDQLVHRG